MEIGQVIGIPDHAVAGKHDTDKLHIVPNNHSMCLVYLLTPPSPPLWSLGWHLLVSWQLRLRNLESVVSWLIHDSQPSCVHPGGSRPRFLDILLPAPSVLLNQEPGCLIVIV